MNATAGPASIASGRELTESGTVQLHEDQRDHAELILEALETALPRWRIVWSSGAEDSDLRPAPDLLILSLSSDLTAARRRAADQRDQGVRTPVVLLKGPADRWSPSDLAGGGETVILDKRAGPSFLCRLIDTVRAACVRRVAPDVSAAAPAASHDEPSPPLPPAESPVAALVGAPGGRPTSLVTGLLVESLAALLERLSPLAELFRARFPHDPATAHYAADFERELGRARAIAHRLAVVAGTEATPSRRPMSISQLITLRAPVWRLFARDGVAFEIALGEASPVVDMLPEVFGVALDDLLLTLVAAAPASEAVRVETGATAADEVFCAARPGLACGRCAHVRGWLVAETEAPRETLVTSDTSTFRPLGRAVAAVKAHGGFVELTSDRASGALRQVTVYAPAAPPRRRPFADVPPRAPRILFVDDDAAVRGVALEVLGAAGFAAEGAASGEEALRMFTAGCRYDLVLLDLFLGGMSGVATYARLRVVDPDVAVVLVSGGAARDLVHTLLHQGLLGFLPKPFNMRELIEVVRAGLGAVA